MNSIANIMVSMVSHATNTKTLSVAVGDILSCIKNGSWRERLEKLRAAQGAGDGEAVAEEKKWLPAVTWSGEFSRRHNDGLIRHSGLVCADIDDIGERLADAKAQLALDQHVLAYFVSVRGNGLKVLFKCSPWWPDGLDPVDPQAAHAAAFQATSKYLLMNHELTCDPGCKDVARLCFVNDDPEAYINLDSLPLSVEPLSLPSPELSVNGTETAQVIIKSTPPGVERIRDLLKFIPKRPKYPEWIRIAGAVWSELGNEEGCAVLKEWSPETKQGEYEELWEHRLTRVKIGTLYHVAREHGWKPPAREANVEIVPTDLDDEDFILRCASRGQRGDAELFNLAGRNSFVFDHTARNWRMYGDGVWKLDEMGATRRLSTEIIASSYLKLASQLDGELSADVHSGKLSPKDLKDDIRAKQRDFLRGKAARLNQRKQIDDVLALSGDFLSATASDFDRRGDLLNLRNGTLNLDTFCLHDHSGSDLLTKQANVEYHPEGDCPHWREFMSTIFGGDTERIAFVQRALGYSLTADVSADAIFFCYGFGRNGKSTLFEVLRRICGEYLVQLPIEALLSQGRGHRDNTGSAEVTRLHGARIALSSEIPEDRRLNEALVKDMTGGDAITARRLYQNPFTFLPTHKLWMAGNHRPEIRGLDEGIWRRINMIPFDHQFPKDGEPGYRDRTAVLAELETEGPGILNWLLEGLRQFRIQGLNPPASVRQATERYRKESDVLVDFIDERCVQGSELTVSSAELWNAYQVYCSGERSAYSTRKAFAFALQQRGFKLHRTNRLRMLKGLMLRREDGRRLDDDGSDV